MNEITTTAETVVQYAYQLAGASFIVGMLVGIISMIGLAWLSNYIANRRLRRDLVINRRTPAGI